MKCCDASFPERFTWRTNLPLIAASLAAITAVALGALSFTPYFNLPGGAPLAWGLIAGGAVTLSLIAFVVYQVKAKAEKAITEPPAGPALVVDPDQLLFECLGEGGAGAQEFVRDADKVTERKEAVPITTLAQLKGLMGPRYANVGDQAFRQLASVELGLGGRADKFTEFPPALNLMTHFSELSLHGHTIREIPERVAYLDRLEVLNLSYNQGLRLTDSVGQLSQLRVLNISACGLEALSLVLNQLEQLKSLQVAHNRLTHLPNLENLRQLLYLNVAGNDLEVLPPEIGSLESLESLNLQNNPRLAALPVEQLSQLRELREIDIEGTAIPVEQRDAILQACRVLRGDVILRPGQVVVTAESTLAQQIDGWKRRANRSTEEWEGELAVDDEQRDVIERWLPRLRDAREFELSPTSFSSTVCDILKVAHKDSSFFEIMLGIAAGDLTGCGDRAAASFTDVYTEYLLYTIDPKAPLSETVKIIVAYKRGKLLRKAVGDKAMAERTRLWHQRLAHPAERFVRITDIIVPNRVDNPWQWQQDEYNRRISAGEPECFVKEHEVRIGEIAEVYLGIDLQSRGPLGLMLPIQNMLFPSYTDRPWITGPGILEGVHREILGMEKARLICEGGSPTEPSHWARNLLASEVYGPYANVLMGFTVNLPLIDWVTVRDDPTQGLKDAIQQDYTEDGEIEAAVKPIVEEVLAAFMQNWKGFDIARDSDKFQRELVPAAMEHLFVELTRIIFRKENIT